MICIKFRVWSSYRTTSKYAVCTYISCLFRLFIMLKYFPIESKGRQQKLREVGRVATICFCCFSARCIMVRVSVHWKLCRFSSYISFTKFAMSFLADVLQCIWRGSWPRCSCCPLFLCYILAMQLWSPSSAQRLLSLSLDSKFPSLCGFLLPLWSLVILKSILSS